MGYDPSPFLTTYLFIIRWINKIKGTDLSFARQFANVFHFIDYLAVFSDGGEFERSYKDLYPPELEIKKKSNPT